jgi:hypothetical protein
VRYWASSELNKDELQLGNAVANWPELNDSLFWASIDEARAAHNHKTGESLTNDWEVSWFNHYWQLDTDAFERVIKWISDKDNLDDRLVALSRAFRIYSANDRPKMLLAKLKQAVSTETELKTQFDLLIKPPICEKNKKWQQQQKLWERRQRERKLKEANARAAYVAELKADPDRLRNPKKLKVGEWSDDQYSLLRIIEGEGLSSTSRTRCANWQVLIPEFGEQVALAWRDAAVANWRVYRPSLGSEGANTKSTPYAQNFALAGLTIEASEAPDFLRNLSLLDARHALRYFVCELNGFPLWFERLYNAFPQEGFVAVWQELAWELKTETHESTLHYVLHDLVYFAPWLHKNLATTLLEWLSENDVSHADSLSYVLHILKGGGIDRSKLAKLAQSSCCKHVHHGKMPAGMPFG